MSDRKALLRAYKEAGPVAGVYAVRNQVEGPVRVAGALNLQGALNRERFELKLGGHRDRALQAAWNRLGPQAFTFEVLQEVKRRDDPTFDIRTELAELLSLWRLEIHGDAEAAGYRSPGR